MGIVDVVISNLLLHHHNEMSIAGLENLHFKVGDPDSF